MMPTFVGEKIAVETDGAIKQPVSFHWRGKEHRIAEVLLSWFDWGFPAGSKQRDWKARRHRNYFRVRTTAGDLFEIYLDRGSKRGPGVWYLFQKLDGESDAR
jgi:hypothetical protein